MSRRYVRDTSLSCPHCHIVFEASVGPAGDPNPPGPGDVAYCAHCQLVAIHDTHPDGTVYLRPLTAEDPPEAHAAAQHVAAIMYRVQP